MKRLVKDAWVQQVIFHEQCDNQSLNVVLSWKTGFPIMYKAFWLSQ